MAESVNIDGRLYQVISEGLAKILIPEATKKSSTSKREPSQSSSTQNVFYNPIQQFNRDLSVLAIKAYGEDYIKVKRQENEARNARKAGKPNLNDEKPESIDGSGSAEHTQTVNANQNRDNKRKADAMELDMKEMQHSVLEEPRDVAAESSDQSAPSNTKKNACDPQSDWKPRFSILDALSATGMRALRYAREISSVTNVTANDLSAEASEAIKLNARYNEEQDKIHVVTGDALSLMYKSLHQRDGNTSKYNVIDLDPYGTAAPFLDGALQALSDGGLLCVTCTDSAVWASAGYPEKTFALYGGTPIKGMHSHEGGLRLVLHSIATTAARYGMAIEPLLSLSVDFYLRVFVRVRRSSAEVKFLAGKTMLVYGCDQGCGSWSIQYLARNQTFKARNGDQLYKHGLAQGPICDSTCEHCGFKKHVSGPMYAGPLHNAAFIQQILDGLKTQDRAIYGTIDRIEGMLTTALEEQMVEEEAHFEDPRHIAKGRLIPPVPPWRIDRHPFYFVPSALAKILHCTSPSDNVIRGALRHAGYRATRSHAKPGTIKTNAPWKFIWSVIREWSRRGAPIKEDAIKQGTPGWKIFHQEDQTHTDNENTNEKSQDQEQDSSLIVFDETLGREREGNGLVRYQINPRADWGPMSRARG